MARVLVKFAAAALALGALGGAAEAQQIDIRITASDRAYTTVGSRYDVDDDDDYAPRRYVAPRHRGWGEDDLRYQPREAVAPRHSGYEYRDPSRYYGRPVQERGYWDRHSYSRPVAVQPYWARRHDCRIVVKQKVNAWGHVVIKQKQICD